MFDDFDLTIQADELAALEEILDDIFAENFDPHGVIWETLFASDG